MAVFLVVTLVLSAQAHVRVVTFNLMNRPWERRARLDAAARVLRGLAPDLVALQEAGDGWLLPESPWTALAERLFPTASRHLAHHWQETNWGVYRNGLSVLSRWPILSVHYYELKASTVWDPKGFLLATVRSEKGPLLVTNVHLRSTRASHVKAAELREMAEVLQPLSSEKALVILGDFNWDWHTPLLQQFARALRATSVFDRGERTRMATWNPSYREPCDRIVDSEPHQQIDNILVTAPLRVRDGGVRVSLFPPHPSDHCPVFARLDTL